jgi:hypothetical protein
MLDRMGGVRFTAFACMFAALVGLGAACGSSSSSNAPSDAQAEDETSTTCAPGEARADDGHCEPAGIPPALCGTGFTPDGDRGCSVVLPADPCGPGQMAVPGETSCHDVAPCADGQWGDIPVDATTQYVDGSFSGTSDGTRAKPWTRIFDAVSAAKGNAIVAIAAGSYPEDVVVKQPLRLWGVCPAKVEIKGVALQPTAVSFVTGSSGGELHAVTVRGPMGAVGVSGATDVVIDHVWIHAVANRAIDIENAFGETSAIITDSLFEGAHKFGVYASGSTLTLERTVVRATQPIADGTFGRGVEVEDFGGVRGNVTLRGSIVEQSHEVGVGVIASDVTIESSVVRDTQARASDHTFGRGIDALQDAGHRATLTVRGSIVANNAEVGILVSGADATIEATMITDGQPRPSDSTLGRGVGAQDFSGQRGNLVIRSCVVARNVEIGIFLAGSDAQIESTLVRDTSPQASDQRFGLGISLQAAVESGGGSTATIHASVIASSYTAGLAVHDSQATIDAVLVRDVKAQLSDGLFGDGVSVIVERGAASVVITDARLEASVRAGVSSFGAGVTIGATTLECDGIALDGEAADSTAYAYTDRGGDVCGCAGAPSVCQVLSSGLAPPAPLPTTSSTP